MFFVLIAVILLSTLSKCEFIKVDPDGSKMFVDQYKRKMFFHGVNAVYKTFPYFPDYKIFSYNNSLTKEDARNLRNWGFNMVRLYVAWEGTEIGPGQYNDTYLGELKQIIQLLSENGIYTLLDCHQDVFSRFYCGEGVPDFYIKSLHPKKTFPKPVPAQIRFDPKTDYPLKEDCLKHNFAEYYFTDSVSSGFQELYTKDSKLYTGFLDFWAHVSEYFKDEKSVLGYELLNEPWAGDIFKDPFLLRHGETDRKYLVPLYKDIYDRINVHDENHMIFFEPAFIGGLEIGESGFDSCPFPSSSGRCVYAYHVYCGIVDEHGAPDLRALCNFVDDFFIGKRTEDWHRLKTAGVFVTEMGALFNDSKSVTELHWVLGHLESRLTNWAYWQFKYFEDYTTADHPATVESFYTTDGELEVEKVKALSRTYAQLTCGTPVSNDFDPDSGIWKYSYEVEDFCSGGTTKRATVVYLNQKWYYPKGYTVTTDPPNAVDVSSTESNYISLTHKSWLKEGTKLSIQISPKT